MTSIPNVIDNPSAQQYEIWLDDERVGLATYAQSNGVVTVPHVETAPAHQGQGIGALLMDGIVDDLRARSLKIRPLCPYAASYMRDRPETHDLYA
jgi:predicted GNAT family acetyltransferase